jgi:Ca2+-binding RTX toxin-like protein
MASAATTVTLNPFSTTSELGVIDATNDADAITISEAGGVITIRDTGTGGITTADPKCTAVDAQTVTCPRDPPDPAPPGAPVPLVASVELRMNAGTDSFTNQDVPIDVFESDQGMAGNKTVSSGPGDDAIRTGIGNDIVDTGQGDDTADGDFGNDVIATGAGDDDGNGDEGNDLVNTGMGMDDIDNEPGFNDGADVLDGGPGGFDEIDYMDGATGVSISMNALPDDGHAGEGDQLLGFEDLRGSNKDDTVNADGADNTIATLDGNDVINAGAGDDEVTPGLGNDVLDAGDGNDEAYQTGPSDGTDVINGGAGTGDEASFGDGEDNLDPVTINQDGLPNDGHAGENDNLAGFEGLSGTEGPDTIVGDAASNVIEGFGGDDTLVGAAGNDSLFGGPGDDSINALGGRDDVDCDTGSDAAVVNAEDIVDPNCERTGARVTSESASVNKKGKASLTVFCPAPEGAPCAGKLALLSNGKTIGKGKFDVAPGQAEKATAKLSKKGRKALAQAHGNLIVTAEARTTEPLGVSTREATVDLVDGSAG